MKVRLRGKADVVCEGTRPGSSWGLPLCAALILLAATMTTTGTANAVAPGRFLTYDLGADGTGDHSASSYLFGIDPVTGAIASVIDGGDIDQFPGPKGATKPRRALLTMATDARGTTYFAVQNWGLPSQPFQNSIELFSLRAGSVESPVLRATLVSYPALTNIHSPAQIVIDRLRNRLVFVSPGAFGVENPELRLYDLRHLELESPLLPLATVELTSAEGPRMPSALAVARDGSVYLLQETAAPDPTCLSSLPPGRPDIECRSLLVKRWEPGGALTVEGAIGLPGTDGFLSGYPHATTYLDPTRGARGLLVTLAHSNELAPDSFAWFLRMFDLDTRTSWDVELPTLSGPLPRVGLTGDAAGNLYVLEHLYGGCSGSSGPCNYDTQCGSACDAPRPQVRIQKLVLAPDGSAAGAFTVDVPNTTLEGDTSLPSGPLYLVPEPSQRIVLDWDTPPDIVFETLEDWVGTGTPGPSPTCGLRPPLAVPYPSTTQELAGLSGANRDAVLTLVDDTLRRSGFDLPVVDTRYYPDDTDRSAAITVQFGASGPVAGVAYDVGCGGRGAMFMGERDRCNRRADARVLVNAVVDSGALPGVSLTPAELARTILHQVGHALGLEHVLPLAGATTGSIMDHVPDPSERFPGQPLEIVEPPDGVCGDGQGKTHDALAQLRITTTCDTPAQLAAAGLVPGSDDACPSCATCANEEALSVTVSGLTTDVRLVAVQRLRGENLIGSVEPWREEPNWIQLAALGDLATGGPTTVRIPLGDTGAVRIVGSTTGDAYDVAFTIDGPSGPMVLFDPAQLGAAVSRSTLTSKAGRVLRYDGDGLAVEDIGAVAVSVEPTTLTKRQVSCATFTHNAFASLLGRLEKAEKACAASALRAGSGSTLAPCLSKAMAKAAKAAAQLEGKAATLCSTAASPLGLPRPLMALAAAIEVAEGQRARVFGVLQDRLEEASGDASMTRCALLLTAQTTRCVATIGKTLATCTKDGLLGKSAPAGAASPFTFAPDMAACIGDDRRAKIAKACVEDLTRKVVLKCAPGTIASLVPECAENPVSSCVVAAGRCEVCRAMVAYGNVRAPCDVIDDAESNGSCSSP